MATMTKQSSLETFLELNGGYTMADFKKMPIQQTQEQIDNNEPVQYVPNEGLVQFEGIGAYRNGWSYRSGPIWDYNTKILYGVIQGTKPDGTPVFRKINIDVGAIFNLAKPFDRENYYILLHSPHIEGGVRLVGKPTFRRIDKEAEANVFLAKKKAGRKAEEIIEAMGPNQLRPFCLLFGISDKSSDSMIKRALYEKAEIDSKLFLERYESQDRSLWEIVKKASAEQVFEKRADGIYFGNVPMGLTEANAVETLKKQPTMCEGIKDSIEAKSTGKKPVKKAEAKVNPFATKGEEN